MPHVLGVTALEIGDPVLLIILMKPDDATRNHTVGIVTKFGMRVR